MPIKPVGGKIKSQELNDNFSYLESILKSTKGGSPKGTFNTLSDLQAAYPNGDDGIYVVTEDGHWYYWDGAIWAPGGVYQAAGIPDDLSFKATNLMKNGMFLKNGEGWANQGGSASIAANTLSVTGDGSLGLVGTYNAPGYRYLGMAGHKIYMRARVRVTNLNANSIRIYASDGTTNAYLNGEINAVISPGQDRWYEISGIIELPTSFEGKEIRHFILAGYASPSDAIGKSIQVFRPFAIDLSQVFGVGSEPTASEVDDLLLKYDNSWYDGTEDLITIKQYIQDLSKKVDSLEPPDPNPVTKAPYELFDDFVESVWVVEDTSTTSLSKEFRKVLTGSESLKITVSKSAANPKAIDKQSVNVLLGENNKMMMKVWVDEPSKISEMNLYLGNEESVWGNYCRMRIAGDGEGSAEHSGGLLRPGWNFVTIIPDEMIYTNNFNWNNPVKRMRITVTPKTNDSTSVIIDSIWINGKGTPKLVITFDDAWKTVYDHAYPIMSQRGIVGTTYVIGQYVDNPENPISPWFCSLNELKDLNENGWTLGNHNWQHDYYYKDGHTPKSYVDKATQNLEWMLEKGIGEGAVHFCYPGGEYDMGVVTQLKAKGFLSARSAKPRGAHPIEIDDHFQILSRNFHSGVTVAQAKKWVDQCIQSGGTTFFQFHQIPIDDTTSNGEENPHIAWSKAKFEELMDYIEERGMANNCLTHAEWYEWAKRSRLLNN